jgi:hypothetical protein
VFDFPLSKRHIFLLHATGSLLVAHLVGKTGTMDQLIEGKANLVRMLEFVKLTEDEKLLVTEGIDLHQALIERLADVPTPAGPTPRELEAQQRGEAKVIPLKTVGRKKKHHQDKEKSNESLRNRPQGE